MLSDLEIEVLGGELGFYPTYLLTKQILNEAELVLKKKKKKKKMRCKWYNENGITENVIETPALHNKSTLNPPPGHLTLATFLSQM